MITRTVTSDEEPETLASAVAELERCLADRVRSMMPVVAQAMDHMVDALQPVFAAMPLLAEALNATRSKKGNRP